MAKIYRGVGGVNREIKQQFRCVAGVNREIKEQYRGYGGVNRKVFNKGIGGIDANTLLMLHGENFTDSSQYNNTITNSNIVIGAGKFANDFSNTVKTVGANVCLATVSALNITNNFTIDFWTYLAGQQAAFNFFDTTNGTDSSNLYGIRFFGSSWSNLMDIQVANNSYMQTVIQFDMTGYYTQWVHFALVYENNIIILYRNGVAIGSASVSDLRINYKITLFNRGYIHELYSYPMAGSIDEFRVSNVARWHSNFTPPTQPYDAG